MSGRRNAVAALASFGLLQRDATGSQLAKDPATWLADRTQPGDLILTGSKDIASRLIQYGTNSESSHAAIVTRNQTAIEAYDYGLTPNEEDEGVFETTFSELVQRSPKLDRLVIRRLPTLELPQALEIEHLLRTAVGNSPPFPTAGTTLTCTLLLLARPAVQRVLDLGGPRMDAQVDRLVEWLIQIIADGPQRVHCSEIATRVYSGAGVDLRFDNPVLSPYLARLRAAKVAPDGKIMIDSSQRRALGRLTRHIRRRARRSMRPPVHKGDVSKVKVRSTWEASGGVVRSSLDVARERIDEAPFHEPDLSDLILPADLERAEPFVTVGTLIRRRGKWQEFSTNGRAIENY